MAGTGALGNSGSRLPEKKGRKPHRKRIGLFVDITPLVDIAFLLLTFFMLSSTWNTPQVLEMSIPPDAVSPVSASRLLTIGVQENGLLVCTTEAEGEITIPISELRGLLFNMQLRTPMVVAVDIAQNVAYGRVIDVLDELQLAERDDRLAVAQSGDTPALSTVIRTSTQIPH